VATVRKLKSGIWNAQVRRKGHPPISKSFINQKDAHTWIRITESEMDRGVFVNRNAAESLTLAEALIRYRSEITPHKKGRNQEERRIAAWLSHPLAKRSLASLQSKDFVKHRDARCAAVASNTVRLELALISHLFTIAMQEWNIPVSNPLANIRKPKSSNARTRRLEEQEEGRLFEACKQSQNPLLYPLVVLAIETAMRLSELLKVEWKDVDLKKRLIFLSDSKNGSGRIIPLSIRSVEAISLIPKHIVDKRLFYTWKQRSDAMNGAFKLAVKKAGMENFHFHDLRHEATSRLFEKGLNVMEIAAISGHKSMQMLQRYTHIRPNLLIDKLDRSVRF
jgi:integrase